MDKQTQQQLIARLRRIEGQVRALETSVGHDSADKVVTQLQAIIAANRAALRFYLQEKLLVQEKLSTEDRRLLARIIDRGA
ncbi:MAG: metal-sensing transcriptional repressor [Candidatus Berkelbacteria bacterium]|nr:MAG: metal-sensing transcriptional repressor [Candidatus Berkelbacteria bacterium]QQG51820.1 MAG: metal-sensing transcriptional repressor [Candidatus Berkelbacteria bacterium]